MLFIVTGRRKGLSMLRIEELVELLDEGSNKGAVLAVLKKHGDNMKRLPAAVSHHHWWAGGFYDHTMEVMNIAVLSYRAFRQNMGAIEGSNGVLNEGTLIVSALVHDLNKLFRYKKNIQYTLACKDYERWKKYPFVYDESRIGINETAEVVAICAECGLLLTERMMHAVTFHHGGYAIDQNPSSFINRDQDPISVILHYSDMMSSVCFGSKPQEWSCARIGV